MDLNEKVKGIVKMRLGMDEVQDDSNFVEDLGCDSLDIVEIIMAV